MRRNAAALFLIVLLTRLPFLGPGFGADADAWRIAGAARTIAAEGHYVASRFPGAPLVEIADSLLLPVGPWALPLASALWGAIGVVAFYLALCRLGARGCFWAALALAFTPVFWIHTTDAMDYAWALGLALVGLAFAVYGRPTLAGLAIGLAIGCRITSAAFLVPIGLLLVGSRARFLVAAVLAAGLALAPSFLTYGTRFLSGYEFGRVPWIFVVKAATRDVWGVIGTVAVGVATLFALTRIRSVPERERWAILSAIVLFGGLFLRLPHDGAYLLPILPFVLLLFGRTLPRPMLVAFAIAMASSSLVLHLVEVDASSKDRIPFAGRFLDVRLGGPMFAERRQRFDHQQIRDQIVARANALPSRAIVLVYEQMPALLWVAPTGRIATTEIVHLLDREALGQARREGRPLFATQDAIQAEWAVYGVSRRELDAQLIIEPRLPEREAD